MNTYSNLVITQQMAAERITPIIKAMMTSGRKMDIEGASIISGNKDRIYIYIKNGR